MKGRKRRTWILLTEAVLDIAKKCHPGDEILDRYQYSHSVGEWKALQERLSRRGLTIFSVGKRYFVMPDDPRLPQLPQLARGDANAQIRALAKGWGSFREMLADLFAGNVPKGLPACLERAYQRYPADDPMPERERQPVSLEQLRRVSVKLSKLQRGLLDWAANYGDRDAPISQLPPSLHPSREATSRSWRRLAERGLVTLEKRNGRLVSVQLTWEGRDLLA